MPVDSGLPAARAPTLPPGLVASAALAPHAPTAAGWLQAWVTAPRATDELPGLPARMAPTVLAYAGWHADGPEGDEAGLLVLHREALAAARGDMRRGTSAATSTYIDVRERLEGAVERARAGRSLPDFTEQGVASVARAHHYHRVQLHLRLRNRWRKERDHDLLDEERAGGAVGPPAPEVADGQTSSPALHFAVFWYRLDIRERRTRDGRLKDAGWWWSMLRHGLGLQDEGDLGSDRNDPTEATARVKLRLAVCIGLGRWLRRWAVGRPYWQQLRFKLPDPEHAAARDVAGALAILRPALAAALPDLAAAPVERAALERLLLRGENVRTRVRDFAGVDARARRQRMLDLAEVLGALAADRLVAGGRGSAPPSDEDGDGDGGGLSCPRQTRPLLRRLRDGRSVETALLMRIQAHLEACPDCQDWWAAACETRPVTALLAAPAAPARRAPRGWLAAGALVTLGAVLVVTVPQTPPEPGLRGGVPVAAGPSLALEVYVQASPGAEPVRLDPRAPRRVGDRLYLRVGTLGGSVPVTVWVESPEGREEVARLDATPTLGWVGEGRTFVALDVAGPWRVVVSSDPDTCAEPTCSVVEMDVQQDGEDGSSPPL